jgi:hypothetical protein
VSTLDQRVDLLVGMTMLAAGGWIAVRRPSSAGRAALLAGAGAFWILSPVGLMGLSTLFLHRPLLAAAVLVPAFARYGWRRSVVPLAAFAAISVTSALAGVYWLTFLTWLAVVVVSVVPGRRTLWPALAAEMLMLWVASLGHLGGWLTDGDRRWTYYAATFALILFVSADATRRVTLDGVLDSSAGSSGLSVGFRAAGEDEFRTPAGDVLEVDAATRAVRVEFDDLGSAVLLHDDPAFDDPAVRVRIERVMRLLANNVTLLRQVEEQRRAMEDSRRRLLEADQHAAEVLLDDVGSEVLPHLSHIATALSECGVSADHKASVLLAQIHIELRSLSSGLGLDVLREGLPAALGELVDGCAIPARLDVSPMTMSQHHEQVLFMVASEAVANAGKHSAANHLMIVLRRVGDDIELVVSDDGCGGAEHHVDGGLGGLSDRVRRLGGSFEVDSPSSGGTVVLARLPAVAG